MFAITQSSISLWRLLPSHSVTSHTLLLGFNHSISPILYNVCFHSYADDTQLYISVEPNDAAAINSITTCLLPINKWMSNNFLKLNEDKTGILLVGPKTKREMLFNNMGKLTPWIKSEVTSIRFRHNFSTLET